MPSRFSSARRLEHSPVSAIVSLLEPRTLLSGNAIYPQHASVAPQATLGNFEGQWTLTIKDEPAFTGLTLDQAGTTATGTYTINDGTSHDLPITSAVINKKRITIEVNNGFDTFELDLKLKGQNSFKGTWITQQGQIKAKATGSRLPN